jgi:NADP-dependent 3-hydroxy acid dehydrogenase YdfG
VQSELGGADILINNAGVMLLAPFTSEQQAEHRQMLEVNLLGAIAATEVFLDQLRDGGGDLINISSVAGRTARSGNAVYAATKWGINGFSEGLRQELQPDIRVTVIEPGAVATELTDHITDAQTKHATQEFVRDLAITPQDIAEVIEVREWDVVRVPPGTWRGYEGGPEGLEILVFGAPNLGENPREDVEGQRDWWG